MVGAESHLLNVVGSLAFYDFVLDAQDRHNFKFMIAHITTFFFNSEFRAFS